MGYSGFVIVARTGDTRLDELACVDDLFVAVTDNVRADGWRIGFLGPVDDTAPGDLANDLALETAAPAIALSVFDSGCAFATAADPSGGAVEFYLNELMVRALVDDDGRFEPLNSRAVAGLLAWAEKASLVVNPDRLAAAIEERPGPFGDGILEFTEALGIAGMDAGGLR
ncbi:hypothetical protein [Catellatospora chokoriensis]|uniref:Uncharacterized protein n=1 Tax=Catellatospora chokoriensis TaxID=310353 RepID=A0A8J3NUE5_9ACTN|nr:hypothetical protein [Catellatospora chokoriensis]GIF92935.1 hypothetical protein Cch02nite_63790 [Catellatospora chokoriensis]